MNYYNDCLCIEGQCEYDSQYPCDCGCVLDGCQCECHGCLCQLGQCRAYGGVSSCAGCIDPVSRRTYCPCDCHYYSRRNPLDTSGIICDFCGAGGVTMMYTGGPLMLGSVPRTQFMACDPCATLIADRNVGALVKQAAEPLKGQSVSMLKVKAHFQKLFNQFFRTLLDSRKIEPSHIFDLQMLRARAQRIKCVIRTGHPKLGSCLELASLQVDMGQGKRPGCLTCITAALGADSFKDIIGDPQIYSL